MVEWIYQRQMVEWHILVILTNTDDKQQTTNYDLSFVVLLSVYVASNSSDQTLTVVTNFASVVFLGSTNYIRSATTLYTGT
jgi:hypothetical protein